MTSHAETGQSVTTSQAISLTVEQQNAVNLAVDCLMDETSENLTIGGYAGCGKTVLIRSIVEEMQKHGKHIAVAAFAGKAVSVLRRKGLGGAQTLHSLMYKPDKVNGKLVFHKVLDLECDGVIVDEASMINSALYEDLLSFSLPVVFVGDHGQLEPIGDNPGIMENPHVKLEKIHRQAEGSAILWLAHTFREGKKPNWASAPPEEVRLVKKSDIAKVAHEYDVVLCGFNKTRNVVNHIVRDSLGFTSDLCVGDRMICLKNSRNTGFFNGMMFEVTAIHESKKVFAPSGMAECYVCDVKTDEGVARQKVTVWLAKGADSSSFPEFSREQDVVISDYGRCITVHKSQGSQWDKVLVIEEVYHKWNPRRWLYTSSTRAAKELGWVLP